METVMASAFQEFSKIYDEFKEKFPNHPLSDEVRSAIGRGKLPSDQWLKARARKMKDLMTPIWARPEGRES